MTFDMSNIVLPEGGGSITMTVEVSKGQRASAIAAIELKTVSGTVPDLQINVSSTAGSPSCNRLLDSRLLDSLPHLVPWAILFQIFPEDAVHSTTLTMWNRSLA
jgi:hypothetical protein